MHNRLRAAPHGDTLIETALRFSRVEITAAVSKPSSYGVSHLLIGRMGRKSGPIGADEAMRHLLAISPAAIVMLMPWPASAGCHVWVSCRNQNQGDQFHEAEGVTACLT